MQIAVLAGFLFAAAAPAIYRASGKFAGWLLAGFPAGLAAYFVASAGEVWRGHNPVARQAWAGDLGVNLALRLDGLSLLFALMITILGVFVIIYGGDYLAGHPLLGRFYGLLLFFMASMLGLVLSDNIFVLYVFWELTSFSSYLLIGFDHDRAAARKAALQALLVTVLGGLSLLGGFVLLREAGGSAELSSLAAQADTIREHPSYYWLLALILLGAFTKSAQFPFHFWLPAAMEAPTPVSAYLHAATMVKAGVFLLARLNPLLGGTDAWFASITSVGAITMVLGAWLALHKTDLKQILAYSTVSVLGILTLLIGLGTPVALKAMAAYLIAHALYKGALFLVAGAVDHETGTRDVDRLGGLRKAMPLTAGAAVVAAISMAGLPPLFGFIGKELFYEAGMHAPAAPALLTTAAVITGALMLAVAAVVALQPFFGPAVRAPKHPHEAPVGLWLGPAALAGTGLILGLAPGWAEGAVGSVVAATTLGGNAATTLALFHGLNPALYLSAASVAGGIALYGTRRRLAAWRPEPAAWGPAALYGRALDGLAYLAAAQTRLLQSGYLRYYLLIIVVSTLGLLVSTLVRTDVAPRTAGFGRIRFYELVLVSAILLGTIGAIRSSSRLGAVAALGVVGIAVALIFALLGAPDLAMTLMAAETLTVILMVLVLYHLPDFSVLTRRRERARDAVVAVIAGAVMALLVLAAPSARTAPSIASYFVENSYSLAHGRNVVNVILTDFRSLDTLGEITVLAVAGVGVYALLRLRVRKEADK